MPPALHFEYLGEISRVTDRGDRGALVFHDDRDQPRTASQICVKNKERPLSALGGEARGKQVEQFR